MENKLENETNETIQYLNSDEAIRSLDVDPYWPKWDTPWWRIVTLNEMGLVHLAPRSIIEHLVNIIDSHYMKNFPMCEAEVPEGLDPYRHISCHCALGGMYHALASYGIEIDAKLPWIRPWFLKYQLPDGGLNCDEKAYTHSKKSSIMSTLPALEAVLFHSPKGKGLTEEEANFVDKGAKYLINHRLIYKSSGKELMSKSFTKLCFPRFYQYDILRGLNYLVRWKELRNDSSADEIIREAQNLLKEKLVDGKIINERISYDEEDTWTRIEDDKWDWRPSKYFPLLEQVGKVGHHSEYLLKEYHEVMTCSQMLD